MKSATQTICLGKTFINPVSADSVVVVPVIPKIKNLDSLPGTNEVVKMIAELGIIKN